MALNMSPSSSSTTGLSLLTRFHLFEKFPSEIMIKVLDYLLSQELINCYNRGLVLFSILRDDNFWLKRIKGDFNIDNPPKVYLHDGQYIKTKPAMVYFMEYQRMKQVLLNTFILVNSNDIFYLPTIDYSYFHKIPPNDSFFRAKEIKDYIHNHLVRERVTLPDTLRFITYLISNYPVVLDSTIALKYINQPIFGHWLDRHQKNGTNMKELKCGLLITISEGIPHNYRGEQILFDIVFTSLLKDLPDPSDYDKTKTTLSLGEFFYYELMRRHRLCKSDNDLILALNTIPYDIRHEVIVWYLRSVYRTAPSGPTINLKDCAVKVKYLIFHSLLEHIDIDKIYNTRVQEFHDCVIDLVRPLLDEYNIRYKKMEKEKMKDKHRQKNENKERKEKSGKRNKNRRNMKEKTKDWEDSD